MVNFRCNKECSEGFYGKNCQYRCKCANGAKCHSSTGRCECGPGWTGIYCDTPCPAGKFGRECKEDCNCKNGASCHHITGQLNSTTGLH